VLPKWLALFAFCSAKAWFCNRGPLPDANALADHYSRFAGGSLAWWKAEIDAVRNDMVAILKWYPPLQAFAQAVLATKILDSVVNEEVPGHTVAGDDVGSNTSKLYKIDACDIPSSWWSLVQGKRGPVLRGTTDMRIQHMHKVVDLGAPGYFIISLGGAPVSLGQDDVAQNDRYRVFGVDAGDDLLAAEPAMTALGLGRAVAYYKRQWPQAVLPDGIDGFINLITDFAFDFHMQLADTMKTRNSETRGYNQLATWAFRAYQVARFNYVVLTCWNTGCFRTSRLGESRLVMDPPRAGYFDSLTVDKLWAYFRSCDQRRSANLDPFVEPMTRSGPETWMPFYAHSHESLVREELAKIESKQRYVAAAADAQTPVAAPASPAPWSPTRKKKDGGGATTSSL
jgi:hypothetical protein